MLLSSDTRGKQKQSVDALEEDFEAFVCELLTDLCRDLDTLLHLIDSELPAIYNWLCSKKLTMNSSKTKHVAF